MSIDQNNDDKNSSTTAQKEVASPCIGICSLDDEDVCVGCYRTIEEIVNWTREDDVWRKQVLENTQLRRGGSS